MRYETLMGGIGGTTGVFSHPTHTRVAKIRKTKTFFMVIFNLLFALSISETVCFVKGYRHVTVKLVSEVSEYSPSPLFSWALSILCQGAGCVICGLVKCVWVAAIPGQWGYPMRARTPYQTKRSLHRKYLDKI